MRCCKSYSFITLMMFLWPSLNPGHIGVIGTSKWLLFDVDPKTSLSPFFNLNGYLTPNVDINLVLKIYTELSSIWYIELCIGPTNLNVRDLWATQRGANREISIVEGSLLLVYSFWYHSWGQRTQLWDVCLSLLHVGFQEKLCFCLMGCDMFVIDKWNYEWCCCNNWNFWEKS